MTIYDTVTLTVKIGANAQVFENILASGDVPGAKLLGCWYSDIGALGKVMVLRGFESEAALIRNASDCCSKATRSAAASSSPMSK